MQNSAFAASGSLVIRPSTHGCRSRRPGGLAHPRLSLAAVLFFCLVFLLTGTRAAGQDNTWQGAANILDFWSNAGEWSLGVVPDGSTNIIIPQGGVLGDTSFTNLNVLTIGSPAELSLQSTTTVANVGSIVDNGTFNINSGATLSNVGMFGGTGVVLNSGTMQGAGQMGSSSLGFPTLVNQAGGTINANAFGQGLTINGVFTSNQGLLEATGGGLLEYTNGIIANTGGTVVVDGGQSILELRNSTVTGGTITALNLGTVDLEGDDLVGTTLNNASGGLGAHLNGLNTLDGSTAAGAVTLQGRWNWGGRNFTQGTINNQTDIGLGSGSSLTLSGDTTLQGGGTVTLGGGFLDGTHVLTNVDNTIQGAGVIGDSTGGFPTLINQAGGTINANLSGQTLSINGVFTNNTGLMEATDGGEMLLFNSIVANEGGTVLANGGSVILNTTSLTNDGGTVQVTAGSLLQVLAPFTQTGGKTQVDGTLLAAFGENVSGGTVLGTGTINGNVTMTGGITQPGGASTPGALIIKGNYDSNAAFNELINGSGNGLLVVNGSSTLESGALLNIELLGGFTPFVGETFTLMDFVSGAGTFANAPSTGFQMDGFNWTIAYNANDIVLDAGSPVTAPTPEPSSLFMLGTGLAAFVGSIWKKRPSAGAKLD